MQLTKEQTIQLIKDVEFIKIRVEGLPELQKSVTKNTVFRNVVISLGIGIGAGYESIVQYFTKLISG